MKKPESFAGFKFLFDHSGGKSECFLLFLDHSCGFSNYIEAYFAIHSVS